MGSSGGSPTHCLPLPQEKRLSTESGLSADSHQSAGTASQGEPEGPLAEEEGLSQQEPMPATQEEVMEETYEEVRLALGALAPGRACQLPPRLLPKLVCRQHQSAFSGGPPGALFLCGAQPPGALFLCGAQQESGCPRPGGGLGDEGLHFKAGSAWALPTRAYRTFLSGTFPDTRAFLVVLLGPLLRLLRAQWAEPPSPRACSSR